VPPDANLHVMARPEHDQAAALAALAAELDAPPLPAPDPAAPAGPAKGAISSEAFARSLAALLPENAIVADESVTFGRALFPGTSAAAPHDWMSVTGGAIGGGIPLATGAAVAAPDRRVVNLEADGSAMYTIQGLWTQARENLDVTTVIFSNRKYAILLGELANVGANPGRVALDMMDLGNPNLDFVKLANGLGVEGAHATNMEDFNDLFAAANTRRGPFVIELAI
jgi:acetolactate synthase-1/2/3 large subunit